MKTIKNGNESRSLMPNYFKIRQGNQWLKPASATCDFCISHGTANSARCTSPAALPCSRDVKVTVSDFGD